MQHNLSVLSVQSLTVFTCIAVRGAANRMNFQPRLKYLPQLHPPLKLFDLQSEAWAQGGKCQLRCGMVQ